MGYSTANIETGNSIFNTGKDRLHSLFLGYTYKRKFEIDIGVGVLDEDRLLGASIAAYSSSKGPINARVGFGLSTFLTFADESKWVRSGSLTLFYLKSDEYSAIVPRIGFVFSGSENYAANFGIDIRLGSRVAGAVLGIGYTIPSIGGNYFGFNVGMLFIDRNRKKNIE